MTCTEQFLHVFLTKLVASPQTVVELYSLAHFCEIVHVLILLLNHSNIQSYSPNIWSVCHVIYEFHCSHIIIKNRSYSFVRFNETSIIGVPSMLLNSEQLAVLKEVLCKYNLRFDGK